MKTAEEILIEFGCPDVPFDENVTMYYPAILSAMEEFANARVDEAMRWRDPKEELPENVGLYLCKCEKELGFYFDIVFFNKVWRSDNVIGWRPIE